MHNLLLVLLFTLGSLIRGKDEARIVFAGDAMQHAAQIAAARQADGSYDYSDCFSSIAPYITDADYAVVNLETPLGGSPYTGYPCFSAPDSYLDALAYAGFDMMLTANNHTLDRQSRGLLRTLDRIDERYLDHLGTYRSREERDSVLPMIRVIGGFKVGFLNYTYGTNGIEVRPPAVVDYIDRELMDRDIRNLREAGAELVAVCIHWGEEYKLLPSAAQKSLADYLQSKGVDMIIGSHPHVIQPMEMRVRDDGRNCFLVYSLGNFISNMKTRDTRGGAVVSVTIGRDSSGRAIVKDAVYRLVFTIPGSTDGNFRLVPAEECVDGSWQPYCKRFVSAAQDIFDRYNINVSRDSSLIKRRQLPPLEMVLKNYGTK